MSSRRVAPLALVVLAAASACAASACTASLDLERFKRAASGVDDPSAGIKYFDVRFSATGMNSHLNEYFELRVVDRENRIRAKAVYVDVTRPEFTLYLARVVERQHTPYRVDFWADHNLSGTYDGIEGSINEKDHAWRRTFTDPLPEDIVLVEGHYDVNFVHDTTFVDILTDLQGNPISGAETLLPFKVTLAGVTPYAGKMMEVRVVDRAADRLVALHRQGRAAEGYTAEVTGVLDEGTPYDILIYADVNEDSRLSAGDPSWKIEQLSTRDGIDAQIDLGATPQGAIDTGER